MSYRAAAIDLCSDFGGIVLWLTLAGMNPLLAAAQMGIYLFLIALIMSRAVCEAGLMMTETSFLPDHLIRLVHPLPELGAANLSLMAVNNLVFNRDMRGLLLSPFLDDQKMAGEIGMKQRSLLLPLALAVVISFIAGSYFFLKFNYSLGGLRLYSYPNTDNPAWMYARAMGQMSGENPADATAYGGFASGIGVTMLLTWMRTQFAWFPLHPLGFAIAPSWSMLVLWFSCFVAWVIKSNVLRFGGIDTFRRLAPFMMGMILGEFTTSVGWAIVSMTTPTIFGIKFFNAPGFPWR